MDDYLKKRPEREIRNNGVRAAWLGHKRERRYDTSLFFLLQPVSSIRKCFRLRRLVHVCSLAGSSVVPKRFNDLKR